MVDELQQATPAHPDDLKTLKRPGRTANAGCLSSTIDH
jgi:hypothetical protein